MTDPRTAHLEIVPGRLRSANVERDTGKEPRRDYVLTDSTVELIRRVGNTLMDPHSTRAWALTGPYGTGKSSFAVYLADPAVRRPAATELSTEPAPRVRSGHRRPVRRNERGHPNAPRRRDRAS